MNDFFVGLQFLTRIKVVRQIEWTAEGFGRSVKYFPMVGAIVGLILAVLSYALANILPPHVLAATLVVVGILLTGGLHCDGLMDTCDGIFSGRSRERMLEIMKDSRVGANGVIAFVLILLIKWSLILDLSPTIRTQALALMPMLGRFAMVIGITRFPYARPDGIGKAFALYAGKKSLLVAALIAIMMVIPFGPSAYLSLLTVTVFTMFFATYITKIIGGLTGDVYGAITELSELVVLLVFLF